ncbi:hypothetical protein [Spongiivirga citrea]|uniref:Glycine dehydrogenase n=1 Tax=Spongiivirga citrea TaxID=1481457 RepID=A0A6M0CLD2_9FLAO|nr:hypothetical protein [Spongiivirga citrea]NER16237.1 hypothetical protein [Spongiivirga citrea]
MAYKKSVLFISCDEAKHICDKVQYGEASGWEKFKLNLRLSWCRFTKAYSKRNNKLSELVQKAEVKTLDNDLKNKMQKELERELSNSK